MPCPAAWVLGVLGRSIIRALSGPAICTYLCAYVKGASKSTSSTTHSRFFLSEASSIYDPATSIFVLGSLERRKKRNVGQRRKHRGAVTPPGWNYLEPVSPKPRTLPIPSERLLKVHHPSSVLGLKRLWIWESSTTSKLLNSSGQS